MSRIRLVQPDSQGRVSGGYLYNSRMADHGAWQAVDVQPHAIPHALRDLDAEPGDLVLADSLWLSEGSLEPFVALRDRGVRTGAMLHSFPSMIAATEAGLPPRPAPTAFELNALDALGTVVVPGPHYARPLAGRAVRVVVASPGIDDAWRAEPRARVGPCQLVCVGAVTPRKGFLDLLEVLAARPRRDDLHCTIVGSIDVDPEYAQRVLELARELGNVELTGQQAPDTTRALVQRAHLLVMPSYDENHPLVLLESAAASVPAVAYAAGNAEAMLGTGELGLVGPIGDTATLARNLERLVGDETERFRMAHACRARQSQLPSWRDAAASARHALTAGW